MYKDVRSNCISMENPEFIAHTQMQATSKDRLGPTALITKIYTSWDLMLEAQDGSDNNL